LIRIGQAASSAPSPRRHAYVLVLLVAAMLRLALLVMFGPRPSYDSIHGYEPYARLILDGTRWMHDAGLGETAVPITTFRMIGYPALIALANLVAGDGWPWLIVAAQIAASLAAIATVMLLARAVDPTRPWVAVVAGLLAACGQTLGTDTAIQTDSLAAAELIAFGALSALGALQRRAIGPSTAIGLGLLPAASFLLRENTDLTVLALLPFAFAWVLGVAPGRLRQAGLMLLILLPLIAANSAQMLWNRYRTGDLFVTTGTQIILLQALMHAAWTGEPVLDSDGPVDSAARQVLAATAHPDGFLAQEELWAVNQRLFDAGANAVQISRRMTADYARAWERHPLAMARASLANLSGELFFLLGNGVRPDPRSLLFGPSGRGYDDPVARALGFVLLGIVMATAGVSFAVTLGFLLSPPIAIVRAAGGRQSFGAADWFRLAVLVASLAFLMLHAIVHFEDRFLAPIEPLAIVAGVSGLALGWNMPGRGHQRRERL
jgi:hypothetical protein